MGSREFCLSLCAAQRYTLLVNFEGLRYCLHLSCFQHENSTFSRACKTTSIGPYGPIDFRCMHKMPLWAVY